MTKKLTLRTNLTVDKTKVRYETLNNIEYAVVPTVMITEGVHCGSGGCGYYPGDEISRMAPGWDMKPFVVYHPTNNGAPVTAADPFVLQHHTCGFLMNTKWDDAAKKLRTEVWIDIKKANEVDERIMEAINNGTMMEVSTGLYSEDDKSTGEWNGEKYDFVARGHIPDHLAALPDIKGACSIADGAGLLRTNQSLTPITNQLSFDNIRQQLNERLSASVTDWKNGPWPWVVDVYPDHFVYELSNSLFRQEYSIDDVENVKINGIPTEVKRVTEYRTVAGNDFVGNATIQLLHEERPMNKAQKVAALIENKATQWTDKDKDYLMTLEESVLDKLIPVQQNADPAPEPAKPPVVDNAKKHCDTCSCSGDKMKDNHQPLNLNDYMATLPPEIASTMRLGLNAHAKEKGSMITAILANKNNPFTQQQLEAKPFEDLQGLFAFCKPEATPAYQQNAGYVAPIYVGNAGGPPPAVQINQEEETLDLPTSFTPAK